MLMCTCRFHKQRLAGLETLDSNRQLQQQLRAAELVRNLSLERLHSMEADHVKLKERLAEANVCIDTLQTEVVRSLVGAVLSISASPFYDCTRLDPACAAKYLLSKCKDWKGWLVQVQ